MNVLKGTYKEYEGDALLSVTWKSLWIPNWIKEEF